ncbi:MAG: phosphocholine cytidylyltransferase family protein [Acidobacteriota bacterium]
MSVTSIVLAAGVGKRLAGSGHDGPKCLLPMGGVTLLSRTLRACATAGVADVVLVTGFMKAAIDAEIAAHPAVLPLRVIENPRFREGAILSLFAAREALARDAIVMDADVLFDPSILADLVASETSAFLCDESHPFTGEEMMLHGTRARVTHIYRGVLPGERVLGEAVGFTRFSAADARVLEGMLAAAVASGRTGIEHEELFDDFLARCHVAAIPTAGRPWLEIDFAEDVARAHSEILPAIDRLPRS